MVLGGEEEIAQRRQLDHRIDKEESEKELAPAIRLAEV